MKLRCIANYRNDARGLVYRVGDELEPDKELEVFLLSDAPGCFEEVKPRKQVRKPPVDKAVKAAPRDK